MRAETAANYHGHTFSLDAKKPYYLARWQLAYINIALMPVGQLFHFHWRDIILSTLAHPGDFP